MFIFMDIKCLKYGHRIPCVVKELVASLGLENVSFCFIFNAARGSPSLTQAAWGQKEEKMDQCPSLCRRNQRYTNHLLTRFTWGSRSHGFVFFNKGGSSHQVFLPTTSSRLCENWGRKLEVNLSKDHKVVPKCASDKELVPFAPDEALSSHDVRWTCPPCWQSHRRRGGDSARLCAHSSYPGYELQKLCGWDGISWRPVSIRFH